MVEVVEIVEVLICYYSKATGGLRIQRFILCLGLKI